MSCSSREADVSSRGMLLQASRSRLACLRTVARPFEQSADLLVGRLREVLVPVADRPEGLRRLRADDLVHDAAELLTGLGRADGDRGDDPRGTEPPESDG